MGGKIGAFSRAQDKDSELDSGVFFVEGKALAFRHQKVMSLSRLGRFADLPSSSPSSLIYDG